MNKFLNPVILLVLVQTIIYAQEICGSQSYGKNQTEAEQRAAASLAQAINSKVSYNSKMEETISGMESSSKDTTIAKIKSNLLNAQAAKYKKGKDAEGNWATACMSVADAAKPYLDRTRELAGRLKNAAIEITQANSLNNKKEAWENVVDIYKELQDSEGVLTTLGKLDAKQKEEYDASYSKAKKEYDSFAGQVGKGVYVKSNSDYFEDKVGSTLADEGGCLLVNNPEDASLRLVLEVEECEIKNDNVMNAVYCNACVKIDLLSTKTGKSVYKDNFTGAKVGWTDKDNACKKALEKSAPELWQKIKGKVQKEGCK